jgi:prolipoprotein diacylglyceryltransferase
MRQDLPAIGVFAVLIIGFLVVGNALFVGRFQRAYGTLLDKDDLVVLFKIMLIIIVIGGVLGYLIAKVDHGPKAGTRKTTTFR